MRQCQLLKIQLIVRVAAIAFGKEAEIFAHAEVKANTVQVSATMKIHHA